MCFDEAGYQGERCLGKCFFTDKNYFLQNYFSKFHQTWKRESGFQERKCFTKSKQGTKDGFSSSQLSMVSLLSFPRRQLALMWF